MLLIHIIANAYDTLHRLKAAGNTAIDGLKIPNNKTRICLLSILL